MLFISNADIKTKNKDNNGNRKRIGFLYFKYKTVSKTTIEDTLKIIVGRIKFCLAIIIRSIGINSLKITIAHIIEKIKKNGIIQNIIFFNFLFFMSNKSCSNPKAERIINKKL